MSTHRVRVRFAAPTPGVDPETGETFESTLHRVRAGRLIQDASRSIFISELGKLSLNGRLNSSCLTWGGRVEAENLGSEAQVSSEQRPSQAKLKAKLERWRSDLAQRRNVRSSSILSNAGIDEIVDVLPRSRRELLRVRNIQPEQWRRHWREILQLIDDAFALANTGPVSVDSDTGEDPPFAVESTDNLPEAVRRQFNISVSAYGRFERSWMVLRWHHGCGLSLLW